MSVDRFSGLMHGDDVSSSSDSSAAATPLKWPSETKAPIASGTSNATSNAASSGADRFRGREVDWEFFTTVSIARQG